MSQSPGPEESLPRRDWVLLPLVVLSVTIVTDPLAAFTPAKLRKLRSFKDPYGIQRFLDDMPICHDIFCFSNTTL